MLCSDGVGTDYSFVYRCRCSQIVSDSEFEISEPCSNYQRLHYTYIGTGGFEKVRDMTVAGNHARSLTLNLKPSQVVFYTDCLSCLF